MELEIFKGIGRLFKTVLTVDTFNLFKDSPGVDGGGKGLGIGLE